MKAMCEDRNVRFDARPEVVMDGTSVIMQRQKKESVRGASQSWGSVYGIRFIGE